MDLLGGYGSDGSDAEDTAQQASASKPTKPVAADGKKRIDYSKLPIAKPLALEVTAPVPKAKRKGGDDESDEDEDEDDDEDEVEEPPLKKAAELEKVSRSEGLSILAALPQPKSKLGDGGGRGARLDVSGFREPRVMPKAANPADVLKPEGSLLRPDDLAEELVPDSLASHPMFSDAKVTRDGRASGDGPSEEELAQIRATKNFTSIKAQEMTDPDWYMQSIIAGGGPAVQGKKLPEEQSMYESGKWSQSTHANPSRVQKRKHQINWLANEAMEKEAELQDRASQNRLTKAQTQMKYGW
mmetsp:Transcript_68928/g.165430  ORF Transcript_68928/g.165430 Transcript_68928/m.165430 type:complete len:299 (+) Transcript_68928:50-946(+)